MTWGKGGRHRVLIIATEFPPGPGGIGAHAFQLANGLFKLGWKVQVVAPQPGVSTEKLEEFNLRQPFTVKPVTSAPSSITGRFHRLMQLFQAVYTWNPDVVVATGLRALWLAAFSSAVARNPYIAVTHGTDLSHRSPFNRFLTKVALRRASAIVAVSNFTAGLLPRYAYNVLRIIPNGADSELFRADIPTQHLRRQLQLEGKQVLLTVGNVTERKAQDVVIRALPLVLEHCPNAFYLVVGLPTRKRELQQLAQDLGLAGHLHFAGVVEKDVLPSYYNLADVFVMVSRRTSLGDTEGYGIVVREAALCGCPAVVSSAGGLPETVIDGVTGLVVSPDNPRETAEAIIRLLSDDGLRQKMSSRAVQDARRDSWASRLLAYDCLLKEILVTTELQGD